jgi:OOP family OmpA-OmpF porin
MKRTAMVGLLALVSWSAQAAHDVPGWRAGVAASFAGFEGTDVPDATLGNKFIEDNAVGFKLYGQYRFNDWFGIEGAYHNTSDFEDESTDDSLPGTLKLSFSGFSAQGLLYVPMPTEEIQVYVKAGYYDFDDELSLEDNTNSSSSESGLVAGFGAMIEVSDRLGIRADIEGFDADVGDLWAVNLGLEYHFGGSTKTAPMATAAPPPEPVAEPPPPPPPPPADSDGDGVTDH